MQGSEQESGAGKTSQKAGSIPDVHEKERSQRVEALRTMSSEHATSPVATLAADTNASENSQWRNGWRRIALIGLLAAVVVGGLTGYLLISRSSPPANTRKPTLVHSIDLGANNLYCSQAPVWSPDGRQIAIIALDYRCGEQNNNAANAEQFIGIFDVTTGKARQIIALKDASAQYQLVGLVSAIAWSPDGKALAAFGPTSPIISTNGATHQALILYTMTGQRAIPRVIIGPPTNIYTSQSRAQVWNVGALSAGPVIDSSLPPALSYHWTADGTIAPDQPFPEDGSTPTGRNANHGAFTFWQSGYLDALSIIDGHFTSSHISITGPVAPTGLFFTASPVVWSSDGRYVVSGISIGGPVAFSTPPTSTVTCPSPDRSQNIPCPSGALPHPNAAFTAAVNATMQGETVRSSDGSATYTGWPVVPVIWSPNGKYLMTILPGDEETDKAKYLTITILDTTTGNPVKQFRQVVGSGANRCSFPGGWSPADKQVALLQCSSNSIILWNTSDLAA
jgi:WD40 repeat protein